MLQLGLGFRVRVNEPVALQHSSLTLTLKPSPSCNMNLTYPTAIYDIRMTTASMVL